MSATADVVTASGMLRRLEDIRAEQHGATVAEARQSIARKVGTTPATLANIRKLRKKIIPSWLMGALAGALIEALEAEVRRCEHEIAIANKVGLDPRNPDFQALQTQVRAARALLKAPLSPSETGG